MCSFMLLKKSVNGALTDVAQWVGHHSANEKVTSSILSQGTCLDCGPVPLLRV